MVLRWVGLGDGVERGGEEAQVDGFPGSFAEKPRGVGAMRLEMLGTAVVKRVGRWREGMVVTEVCVGTRVEAVGWSKRMFPKRVEESMKGVVNHFVSLGVGSFALVAGFSVCVCGTSLAVIGFSSAVGKVSACASGSLICFATGPVHLVQLRNLSRQESACDAGYCRNAPCVGPWYPNQFVVLLEKSTDVTRSRLAASVVRFNSPSVCSIPEIRSYIISKRNMDGRKLQTLFFFDTWISVLVSALSSSMTF